MRRVGVLISQAADNSEMNASLTGFRQELNGLDGRRGAMSASTLALRMATWIRRRCSRKS